MLVLEIKEEVYHSTKNGKDYLSYPIRYGIEREVNGQKVMQLGYCKLANSNSIQKLIAKGKINRERSIKFNFFAFKILISFNLSFCDQLLN